LIDVQRQTNLDGHYARKQVLSRDKLVAWSHRRRFETALALANEFPGKRVLDFGCGDGTFLGLMMNESEGPRFGVGADLCTDQVVDCRRRYLNEPRLRFVTTASLDTSEHAGQYDAVFCLEVLEHVIDWQPELDRFARLMAPGAKLVISVPVEIGPSLVVKQLARRIAGWRRIGHYPGTTSYSLHELASSVFAGCRQHVVRPVFDAGAGPFHDHKGFNWMVLRERVARDFVIERCFATPFPALGWWAATQVWFVARLRAGSTARP
jgi:SAM-dependent methyltransferase